MKFDIVRSIKYLLYLVVLFAIVYGATSIMGLADSSVDNLSKLASTSKGQMLICAIIGLAVLYPFFGVTRRKLRYIEKEEIILAMDKNGFKLKSEINDKLIFTPKSVADRIKFRFDDTIEIDNSDKEVTIITGARRAVFSLLYKLGSEVL